MLQSCRNENIFLDSLLMHTSNFTLHVIKSIVQMISDTWESYILNFIL